MNFAVVAYLICFHSKAFFEIKNKLKSLLLSIVKTEKKNHKTEVLLCDRN